MTPLSIRLTVLSVLAQAQPYAVPQEQVLREVNLLVRPALTLAELVKHLAWLQRTQMVAFLPDDLDPANPDARKWLIKEAGLAALKK